MSDKLLKEKWVARDRSIFSAVVKPSKSDFGVDYQDQEAVAFNVGPKIAKHIVEMHNLYIDEYMDLEKE